MNWKAFLGRIAVNVGTAVIHAGAEAVTGKVPAASSLVAVVETWLEGELKQAAAQRAEPVTQ